VSALLMPLALVQGRRFLAMTTMAPPAAGAPSGSAGTGDGPPLRLVLLGDSTAAGHGVDSHEDGIAAQVARRLADQTGRRVTWTAIGQFGATTRRIRHRLLPMLDGACDVAILSAGANDVLARRSAAQSRTDYAAILDALAERAERVVAIGAPPFRALPALPWALSRYLAVRGDRFDAMVDELCRERGMPWLPALTSLDASFFASDGFHPSATGYGIIAAAIAEILKPVGAR
jgi:lysophospholipase L1-like esterase